MKKTSGKEKKCRIKESKVHTVNLPLVKGGMNHLTFVITGGNGKNLCDDGEIDLTWEINDFASTISTLLVMCIL